MFKFIIVSLVLLVAAAAVADDTTSIVERAIEALDAMGNSLGDDDTEESMPYMYSEGALEDNINIAVNAAILDKYGQAVTSELSKQKTSQQEDKKVPAKSIKAGKSPKVTSAKPTKERVTANKVPKPALKTAAKTVPKIATKPATTAKTAKTPASDNSDTVTHFVSHINPDGTYGFDFAQSSGLEYRENGKGGEYAEGSYQYISPEGEHISVTYTADENGFHPESDSIPTPPPIPAYILKALDYIRDHPTAEELADREVRAKQI